MAGRRAKPTELIVLEGKSHRTKAELEARRKKEEALKSKQQYRANRKVRESEIANKTFKRLKKLYENISYIDGLDENIINRYCLLTAEVDTLEKLFAKMDSDLDECDTAADRIKLYKTMASIEVGLNKKRDMLMKLEDRLFLNPTSRIKNVPQPKKETPPESKWDKFKGVGS